MTKVGQWPIIFQQRWRLVNYELVVYRALLALSSRLEQLLAASSIPALDLEQAGVDSIFGLIRVIVFGLLLLLL